MPGGVDRSLFYVKHPVDCDDEESLEERRGRTMLRTAMVSTRANRNYGPPDGIQPDSLNCCTHSRDSATRIVSAPRPTGISLAGAFDEGAKRYNIILVRESLEASFFHWTDSANVVPNRASCSMANCMPQFA